MSTLLWIGIILAVLWLIGWAVFEVAGFLIHVLLIVALVMLVMWAVRRFTGPTTTPPAP